MMNRRINIIVLLLILALRNLGAQKAEDIHLKYVEELTEEIISTSDKSPDLNSLFQDIYRYIDEPVNLNTASREELEQLHFLSDFQIISFLDYRKEYGQLVSIHELNYVFGFNENTTRLIAPFVTIQKTDKKEEKLRLNDIRHARHEAICRIQRILEVPGGYDQADSGNQVRYPGSPLKFYNRYSLDIRNKLMTGIVLEKDPGEEFPAKKSTTGFDFFSGYIKYQGSGWLRQVVLGDYHMESGQGLVIWSDYANGKSAYIRNTQRNAKQFKGNRSVDENRFLRGLGIKLGVGRFDFDIYTSIKKIDANIEVTEGTKKFTSLLTSGYHRTSQELEKRKALKEKIFGCAANFKVKNFSGGVNFVNVKYGFPKKPPELPHNIPYDTGHRILSASGNYRYIVSRLQFFGELAKSNQKWASLNGVLMYLNSQLTFATLYRSYQTGYSAPYSNAFAENSANSNEKGFFSGLEWQISSRWYLKTYADLYYFPWLKYQANRPTIGHNYFIETGGTFNETVNLYLKYTSHQREKNNSAHDLIQSPVNACNRSIRVHIQYSLTENLQMKNRFEWRRIEAFGMEPENGFLIYQDIDYHLTRYRLQFSVRYAMFNTESYASRIYGYERDMRYVFNTSVFYGEGSRTYILIRYHPKKWIDLYLKYAATQYYDREKTGTGPDEIRGNRKSEIKMQVIFKM